MFDIYDYYEYNTLWLVCYFDPMYLVRRDCPEGELLEEWKDEIAFNVG